MTPTARTLNLLLRVALATAMTLSWLILSGPPAHALVRDSYVERPQPTSTLKQAKDLVVVVERSAPPPPEDETIVVDTDLYYAGNPAPPQPEGTEPPAPDGEVDGQQQAEETPEPVRVNAKPYRLMFRSAEDDTPAGQTLRFGEMIDPYALVWAGGVVAPNGLYELRHWTISRWNDEQSRQDWQPFHFRVSAPPPPQEPPLAATDDAAAKRTRVAWRHNAAPDITSYTIERKRNDGEWQVAQVDVKPSQDGANVVTDTVSTYGTYRYRIIAFRPAGDGSGEVLATTSDASAPLALAPPDQPAPRGTGGDDGSDHAADDGGATGGAGNGDTAPPSLPSNSASTSGDPGFGTDTQPFAPGVAAPRDFDDTYRGPLDYGVEPKSVTERVPVDIARGGTASDGTLRILDRAIDQGRVLPPLAGGLILVVSAAHVLRYLNE